MSTPISKIRAALERDRELREKATPGPWLPVHGDSYNAFPMVMTPDYPNGKPGRAFIFEDPDPDSPHEYPGNDSDADFVSAARNVDLGAALRIAVEALGRHKQSHRERAHCVACVYSWPCPESEALARIANLLPEEEG